MRNTLTIIMCVALILAIAAGCGSSISDAPTETPSDAESFGASVLQQETPAAETVADMAETVSDHASELSGEGGGSGVLVIYFSAADNDGIDAVSAATVTEYEGAEYGAAQLAAQWIADYTGGDLSPILTEETYPEEYEAMADKAKTERDDNVHPVLRSSIDRFNQYDTVFLVYPIWWYQMPMAMYSLADAYDFSDKTVLVATTHEGSGLSGTIEDLKELEPGANIIDNGYTERAGNIADSKEDVESWLEDVAEFWRS